MAANDNTIRPFRVDVPQEDVAELRRRIAATRWPERETVADESQGVQLSTMQELVRYWGTEYDFRRFEARLNALPQFITEIDGLDIHFLHVKSPHENALPLIITHGWPGSVIEMLNVVGPLTDPTAHDGDADDAFDVVVRRCPATGSRGTDGYRLGPGPHRGCLDRANEASGIYTIRRARRRLGCGCHGCDGGRGTSGVARHSLQHARHGPT